MSEIKEWATGLTKRVYNEWKEKYPFWKSGFKVFYSPVMKNPPILILGYNPGVGKEGGERDFEEDLRKFEAEAGDFSPPEEHSYIKGGYPAARGMRKLLDEKLLRQSVKTNIIFFRSKNTKDKKFRDLLKSNKGEMEKFCFENVRELINKLEPKLLLVEGFKTYDKLWKMLTGSGLHRPKGQPYYVNEWSFIKIIAISHPSWGVREKDKVKKEILKNL